MRSAPLLHFPFRWNRHADILSFPPTTGRDRGSCTILRLKDAGGQISPDQQLQWFPRHTADDPFVNCLGFTDRAARLMRLCGFALSLNEAYENYFLVLGRHGPLPHSKRWRCQNRRTNLFWSLFLLFAPPGWSR